MSEAFVKTLKRDYARVTPLARCRDSSRARHRMVLGLQCQPPAFSSAHALACRVPRRNYKPPDCPVKRGALHKA